MTTLDDRPLVGTAPEDLEALLALPDPPMVAAAEAVLAEQRRELEAQQRRQAELEAEQARLEAVAAVEAEVQRQRAAQMRAAQARWEEQQEALEARMRERREEERRWDAFNRTHYSPYRDCYCTPLRRTVLEHRVPAAQPQRRRRLFF